MFGLRGDHKTIHWKLESLLMLVSSHLSAKKGCRESWHCILVEANTYSRNSSGLFFAKGCLPNNRLYLNISQHTPTYIALPAFLTWVRRRTTCLLYGCVHPLPCEIRSRVRYSAVCHRRFFCGLGDSAKEQQGQNRPACSPYFYPAAHCSIWDLCVEYGCQTCIEVQSRSAPCSISSLALSTCLLFFWAWCLASGEIALASKVQCKFEVLTLFSQSSKIK